jgi:tetratricopeptide (TPR) repeat protein
LVRQAALTPDEKPPPAGRLWPLNGTASAECSFWLKVGFRRRSPPLRRATDLDPQDAMAHHMLGRAFLHSDRFAEAAASLRLAVTLEDGLPGAHHDLALALDRQGLHIEAIAAYHDAVRQAPEWAEGHRRLAELLQATGDVEEAIGSYRRAAAAAPETPAGRLNLIEALMLEQNYCEAEVHLRRAIALDPGSDLLYNSLGNSLSKQGRFAEAIEACDRALAINPLQVPAHLIAVQARKCSDADRPRLERMLATLREPLLDDEDRLFLHYAIGKLLDDIAEYREAMLHFDAANNIKRLSMSFDRELFSGHVDWLMRRFTPDFFAAHQDFALDNQTPVLIVGMPRSGTTLVEQIISSHPQVAAGGESVFWTKRAASWGVSSATYLTAEAARDLAREYLAMLHRIGPLGEPGNRQSAVQSVPLGVDTPAAPQGTHHPLPPASDRYLPVDVLHKF